MPRDPRYDVHFLDPVTNTRNDEYGGSLANRVRLIRELIEETKDAVGDRCAVAVRFAADEVIGEDGVTIGADHVALATGAHWRGDYFNGKAFVSVYAINADVATEKAILTPDDIMAGVIPEGPVLVFDADNYYLGGVVAERLVQAGLKVTLCTPSDSVSAWAQHTAERWRVRTRLMTLGVKIITAHSLTEFSGTDATLCCAYSGEVTNVPVASVVMVTQRKPNDVLYQTILQQAGGEIERLPFSLQRIGDCEAPSIVAAAVYAGHRYAQELDNPVDIDAPLKHERVGAW